MPADEPNAAVPNRRLHPWSWLFVLLQQLKQFILPLLALLVFGGRGERGGEWQYLGPLIAISLLVGYSVLQFFTYRYRIGADGLSIRSGWLSRNLRDIPFARIHNVMIHQSLLHRLFGVAEVRLESAGGQKPEAEMRVLSVAAAHELEHLVRHRGSAPPVDAPTPSTPPPLLQLSTAEVLRLGFVSNRGMIVLAAGFGAAWQLFPEDVIANTFERYARQLYGYAAHLHPGIATTALAVASLVVLGLMMTRVLSMALALTQYHGFRLSEADRRLTVERGLLARLRTSVARRRIQAWTLQESWLQRRLARRSLRIDTAVADNGQQGEQRALKELAPIATPMRCDALIQHLLPEAGWPLAEATWQPLSASMRWRPLLLPVCVLLPVAGFLTLTEGAIGLLPLLWLPWSALRAWQHARRAGYACNDHLVAVRGGWWSRYWRFSEIDKLQGLRLVRSPLDRRCGTASLLLDTAGATGLAPPLRIRFMPEAEARALFERLGAALARQRLRW